MKVLLGVWRAEPAAVIAVLAALVAALAIPDAWAKLLMALVSLVGGGIVRQTVYSPATVNGMTAPPVPPAPGSSPTG